MKYIFSSLAMATTLLFMLLSCTESQQTNQEVTLDEKIGQMLMVGFKGFEVSDTSHVVRDIQTFHTGGIILFDYDVPSGTPNRNIDNENQVTQLIDDLQQLSDTPLFIAVDQEGGQVARLKTARGFLPTKSAEELGEINNPDTTRYYASQMAGQLQHLGFNVNFAPVVDLNTNPMNPVIGQLDRSFSPDPDVVTRHASIFLGEFNRQGVLGVLKHFPGHGSAWNDSHVGMADVTDTWEEIELEPYKNLVEMDEPFAVMTAHVFNENLDEELPATLSHHVQTEILRNQIGFEGVLFSDDMQMDAIRSFYGLETSIKNAINAGVDVLVFANNSVYDREIIPTSISIIKNLIDEGEITLEMINESYERIIAAKENL